MPRKLKPASTPKRPLPLPTLVALWLLILAASTYALTAAYHCALNSRVVNPETAKLPAYPAQADAKFVRAVDGDTVRVLIGGNEERVQLLGVDAPEMFRRKITTEGESVQSEWQETGDLEAAFSMQQLEAALKGKQLTLEFGEPQRDQYGRLEAWVWVGKPGKGTLINEWLLQHGLAKLTSLPRGCKYAERMKAAEDGSSGAAVGLED